MRRTIQAFLLLTLFLLSSPSYANDAGCWEIDLNTIAVQQRHSAGKAAEPAETHVSGWETGHDIRAVAGQNDLPVFLCFDTPLVAVVAPRLETNLVAKIASKHPAFAKELVFKSGLPSGPFAELGWLTAYDAAKTYWAELPMDQRHNESKLVSTTTASQLFIVFEFTEKAEKFTIFGGRREEKLQSLGLGEYISDETTALTRYKIR